MKADTVKLFEFLEKSKTIFSIPVYQRNYEWQTEHCEELFCDLESIEARDLLDIIHARHKRGSTIFCSQFAPVGWYSRFSEATIADAILDRIVHDSYTIEIQFVDKDNDKSMREVYGIALELAK